MTCRFCKKDSYEFDQPMLKYSTRHYAHHVCWMKRYGIDSFDPIHGIPLWKLKQFPYLEAKSLGLQHHLAQAIAREEAHEKALAKKA